MLGKLFTLDVVLESTAFEAWRVRGLAGGFLFGAPHWKRAADGLVGNAYGCFVAASSWRVLVSGEVLMFGSKTTFNKQISIIMFLFLLYLKNKSFLM